jgi:hypothetical protein
MTKREWRECIDPEKMLMFARGKVSDRKIRLFACACCRRVWDLFLGEESPRAVATAEAYADGTAGPEQMAAAYDAAYFAAETPFPPGAVSVIRRSTRPLPDAAEGSCRRTSCRRETRHYSLTECADHAWPR